MKYDAILIDTSVFVAHYNKADDKYSIVSGFFSKCESKLITSTSCITETMWMLKSNYRVQNFFLSAFLNEVYIHEPLTAQDILNSMRNTPIARLTLPIYL